MLLNIITIIKEINSQKFKSRVNILERIFRKAKVWIKIGEIYRQYLEKQKKIIRKGSFSVLNIRLTVFSENEQKSSRG